ncbi:hypothetical protein [Tessaracoccus sp.]
MSAATRFIGTLTATLLATILASSVAVACSCVEQTTAENAAGADLVARVTVERANIPESGATSSQLAVYTMRPTHVWKGDVVSQFKVSSQASGASCGLEGITEGQDLLLFAQESEEGWTAHLCGGTTVASEPLVAELLDVVGPGVAVDAAPGDTPGEWIWPTVTAVSALAVITAVILWWWVLPRRRP